MDIAARIEPRIQPRAGSYREALSELAGRYGSGLRALEELPAHMQADGDAVLAQLGL